MKELKFKELIKIREIITKISQNKFSISVSYQLAKFLRETDNDANFYNEKLNEFIKEYRDSSFSEVIKIKEDKISEWNNKISELDNQIIKVPEVEIDINKIENIEMTPEEIYWLFLII